MWTVDDCICGLTYAAFRTGLTFADVKAEMYVASDDPSMWRYRTRRMVLGCWREMKLKLFASHRAECEHHAKAAAQ